MVDSNQLVRGSVNEVAQDVYYVPALMANLYFVGTADEWVMVDAGTPGTATRIRMAAQSTFGDKKPQAIVLTHGHFDHIGALRELAESWDVPIFAHPLEFPFLDGRDNYPPPDPTVGGFMAQLSRMFPKKGINVGDRLRPMMIDGSIPHMPGWRVVFTPGHSPGHVSLFRDSDRTLIAGDAIITIDQEHASKVISQVRELHPPPLYFTTDWDQATESIFKLAQLRPRTIATGHGLPMSGDDVADQLTYFAQRFRRPDRGRYVSSPALADEQGYYFIPPAPRDMAPVYAAGAALAAAGLLLLGSRRRHASRAADSSLMSGSLHSADNETFSSDHPVEEQGRTGYGFFGRRQ